MPALFVFLFKVNIALLLFCTGYYLVLRHLTFYSLNRVYLVTAIVFASLYPKIDLSSFAQQHENIAKPVQNVALIWTAPAEKLTTDANYWPYAEIAFWLGAALLAARLAVQLFSLFKLYRNSKPAYIHKHEVRLMDGDAAPFSFWQSIYVNPANHTPADLEAILLHEQVHVNGWHTIDILLAELSSIFYWFNPGIWLIKKAVRENIEFITDRKILNKGFDSKTYQYSLVNVSFNNNTPGIVNHFNISTIKKRIIMMNAKRSKKVNLTRYVFVVPVVVAMLLAFTLSKAEVAKPITIKLKNAIKPVTTAITNTAVNVISDTKKAITGIKTPVKKDTVIKSTITLKEFKTEKDSKFKQDPLVYRVNIDSKTDTGKKWTVVYDTNTKGDDLMNVVIDGKKMDVNGLKNVNPERIAAVNIISQDALGGMSGINNNLKFDNDRKVVFITTKDSEEGKKLIAKLGPRIQLTEVRLNGVDNATKEKLTGTRNVTTVIAGDLVYKANATGKVTAINGKKQNGDSTIIYTSSSTNGQGATTTTPLDLADKLYIINGKEATEKEVKKISFFDIDHINISKDADANKKYGDKAKNGVVYIYTKKGK